MAYSILFEQCGSDHMTRGRLGAIDRIVLHFTATLASARNNATYFARNEGQGTSAHYFIDDITPEIYQSVTEGDTAWHAGNWAMSYRAIGIEVISAGEDFSATEVVKSHPTSTNCSQRLGRGWMRFHVIARLATNT